MNRLLSAAAVATSALTLAGCGGPDGPHNPAPGARFIPPGSTPGVLALMSPAVGRDGALAARYTCDGLNVAPPLFFAHTPRQAAGLAVVLLDLDARAGSGPFLHWVVFDIPRDVLVAPENEIAPGAQQAATSFGVARYQGPCPPPGSVHHYRFILYAERTNLRLTAGMPGADALQAIRAGALASAELPATYARHG